MIDIHDLGRFGTLGEVYEKYPSGGCAGDYVTVAGSVIYWNDIKRKWGDFDSPQTPINDFDVDGNLSVSGNVSVQGEAQLNTLRVNTLIPESLQMVNPPYALKDHTHPYAPLKHEHETSDIRGLDELLEKWAQGTGGTPSLYIIAIDDDTPPNDANVYSALRSDKNYISKVNPDIARALIDFEKGIRVKDKASIDANGDSSFNSLSVEELSKFKNGLEVGSFSSGSLGTGGCFKELGGKSYLELDNLFVRNKATFEELQIRKLSHVSGGQIFSAAGFKCTGVDDFGSEYRCYFKSESEGVRVTNGFVIGDQAIVKEFNKISNTYYWGLVIGVGGDYIDLSKSDVDAGSVMPKAGDDIVQLGNRTNVDRQNAIIISSAGVGSPYIVQYKGINSFDLSNAEVVTRLSKDGNLIKGDFIVESTGENINSLIEANKNSISTTITKVDGNTQSISNIQQTANNIELTVRKGGINLVPDSELIELPSSSLVYNNKAISIIGRFKPNTTYTLSMTDVTGSFTSTEFNVLVENVVTGVWGIDGSELLKLPTTGDIKVTFTTNSNVDGSDDFKLLLYSGILGYAQNQSMNYHNVQLEEGSIATAWKPASIDLVKDLLATGINIEDKKVTVTSNKFLIQDNTGQEIAVFKLDGNGKPVLKAENIDVDSLYVKHLRGADGDFTGTIKALSGTFGNLMIIGNDLVGLKNGKENIRITLSEISSINDIFSLSEINKIASSSSPGVTYDNERAYRNITYDYDRDTGTVITDDVSINASLSFNLPIDSSVNFDRFNVGYNIISGNVVNGVSEGTVKIYKGTTLVHTFSIGTNHDDRYDIALTAGDYTVDISGTVNHDNSDTGFDAEIYLDYIFIGYKEASKKTIIGSNGLASIYDPDNYIIFTENGNFEVRKNTGGLRVNSAGVAQVMKNGLWVNL